MVLSGTTGVVVTGFYVQDGRRITISNALPWSFEGERISSFEIRKLNPDDALFMDMSYDGNGAHAKMKKPLGPGVPGMRVQVQNGLISQTVEQAHGRKRKPRQDGQTNAAIGLFELWAIRHCYLYPGKAPGTQTEAPQIWSESMASAELFLAVQ